MGRVSERKISLFKGKITTMRNPAITYEKTGICQTANAITRPIPGPSFASVANLIVATGSMICLMVGYPSVDQSNSTETHRININQYGELLNISNNVNDYRQISIDLQAEKNRSIILDMESYPDNWNGYGASSFSPQEIHAFLDVVLGLVYQPEIMPTARHSLLLRYLFLDQTELMFELFSDHADEVLVPNGDFSKAKNAIISSDVANSINSIVGKIYESIAYR